MRIFYGLEKFPKLKNAVVALGVFDGVHIGHRYILRSAVNKARAIKTKSVVVTFFPHPQKDQSLYSLAHRLKLILSLGVDLCLVIKFTPKFSRISAESFVKDILVDKIGAKYIFVGKNFRFGRAAQGDWKLLNNLSQLCGYKLNAFRVVRAFKKPISSTCIRKLILQGKLAQAQKLLNSPVTVLGTVIKGISLARKLGFPTANINPHHEILPPSGVYAVKVIRGLKIYQGICNIGNKPTLSAALRKKIDKHVEVYIFDFRKNIYGQDLEIQFVSKIREEKKFPSLLDLKSQIKKDILKAQKILSSTPNLIG